MCNGFFMNAFSQAATEQKTRLFVFVIKYKSGKK